MLSGAADTGEPPPPRAAIKMAQPTNTMAVLDVFMPYSLSYRQPGDLGVLEGVAEGVWKEARTRGFASLPLGRFAFR